MGVKEGCYTCNGKLLMNNVAWSTSTRPKFGYGSPWNDSVVSDHCSTIWHMGWTPWLWRLWVYLYVHWEYTHGSCFYCKVAMLMLQCNNLLNVLIAQSVSYKFCKCAVVIRLNVENSPLPVLELGGCSVHAIIILVPVYIYTTWTYSNSTLYWSHHRKAMLLAALALALVSFQVTQTGKLILALVVCIDCELLANSIVLMDSLLCSSWLVQLFFSPGIPCNTDSVESNRVSLM